MGLLDFIKENFKVLHKSASIPTEKSKDGFHFVSMENRKAVAVVSRGKVHTLFDTEIYKTKKETDDALGKKADQLSLNNLETKVNNMAGGTFLLGEKANVAAIRAIANPKRGDTWKALDTGHYWSYDGSSWNDIGEIIPGDVAKSGGSVKTLKDVDDSKYVFSFNQLKGYNVDVNSRILFEDYKYYGHTVVQDKISNGFNIPDNADNYTLSFVTSIRKGEHFGSKYIPLLSLVRSSNNSSTLYIGMQPTKHLNVNAASLTVSYNKQTTFEAEKQYVFNIQFKADSVDVFVNDVLEMTLIPSNPAGYRIYIANVDCIYIANVGAPKVANTSYSDASIGHVVLTGGNNLLNYNDSKKMDIVGVSLPLLEGYKKISLPYLPYDRQLAISIKIDEEYRSKGNGANNFDGDILTIGTTKIRVSRDGYFYVIANGTSSGISNVSVKSKSHFQVLLRLYDTHTLFLVDDVMLADLEDNYKFAISSMIVGKSSRTDFVAKFKVTAFTASEIFNPIKETESLEPEITSSVMMDGFLHNAGFSTSIGIFGYPAWVEETLKRYHPFGVVEYFKGGDKKVSFALFQKNFRGLSGKKKISIIAGSRNELGATKVGSVKEMVALNGSSIQFEHSGYTRIGEYIHPSIAYHKTGIAGYKYWMFASNYPAEQPRYEDDDLLVSNDGYNWYRVLPKALEKDNTKPMLPPNVFVSEADKGRENSFIPIPSAGTAIKMNGNDFTPAKTLKHDPEIHIEGDEVFLYNFYNFFEDTASTIFHRFVVVISTRNGKEWFINRSDGSQIPATVDNIKELFTQSSVDGKDNYIRYFNKETVGNRLDKDTAYSIVKVSDNEWYAYVGEYQNYNNSNMGLKRYKGTSHLSFDWTNWEYCISDRYSDRTVHQDVQHFNGKYYVIGRTYVFESTDGVNFKELPHTPFVMCCAMGYRVNLCVGDNSKIMVACGSVMAGNLAGGVTSGKVKSPTAVKTFIQEFPSFEEFVNYCNTGRKDSSIGVLVSCHKPNNKGWFKWIDASKVNTASDYSLTLLVEHVFEHTDNVNVLVLGTSYFGNTQWVEISKNLIIE